MTTKYAWRRADDDPPPWRTDLPMSQEVLVIAGGVKHVAILYGHRGRYWQTNLGRDLGGVTHWQPLPADPPDGDATQ